MIQEKRIEDYLHLYLGCEVSINNQLYENTPQILGIDCEKNDVKPILRPLSDMSEEEMEYCGFEDIQKAENYIRAESFSFEQVRYLLSKHFDLFGLIPAGLVIDKTTLK